MSRDGSGNYNLPAGNPVVTGTVISSTQFNSTMTDIATAMTQSISKDGQTTPTNNLPMGGNKHTGVADGNLGNQYASINQTQNGSLNKATAVANVVDAYTASLTPAIASYTDGQLVTFVPSVTNTTTTVTLALNGLAAKPVNKEAGVACAIGDIVLNVPIYLVYYATGGYFLLLNPQKITGARLTFSNPTALVGTAAVNGSATTFMRSDAAPAIDQTAAPVMSSLWTFAHAPLNAITGAALFTSTFPLVTWNQTGAGTNAKNWDLSAFGGQFLGRVSDDGGGTNKNWLAVSRTGASVTDISLGNATDNNTFSFLGTGAATFHGSVTAAGPANVYASQLVGSSTSGQSFGLNVNAGTTSADIAAQVTNQSGGTAYFRVRGDGVVFGNDGTNLLELGYKDVPLGAQAGNYTAVLSDRGKAIYATAAITVTIPNAVFSASHVLNVVVGSGAAVTIAQGSGLTLQWVGNGATTGSRTLTGAGMASILFLSSSVALISGAGLT